MRKAAKGMPRTLATRAVVAVIPVAMVGALQSICSFRHHRGWPSTRTSTLPRSRSHPTHWVSRRHRCMARRRHRSMLSSLRCKLLASRTAFADRHRDSRTCATSSGTRPANHPPVSLTWVLHSGGCEPLSRVRVGALAPALGAAAVPPP